MDKEMYEEIMADAIRILPVVEKLQNTVAEAGLSVELGCYALATTICGALQQSRVIESDKRNIARTIIMQLANDWFPEIEKYVSESGLN